jgi:glycosyltransferase involved in cell wall biosynthesis
MSVPAISVLMSVYNNAPHLPLAIESILAQSFGDFEFLVLNDGSTDASGAIMDDYARRDSRVRAIHQENRGLIVSLNRMIDEARAPLLARMDGDDIALPERFARQIAILGDEPDLGVLGTWVNCIDEQGRPRALTCGDQPVTDEAFLANLSLKGGPLLCHPAVMMRAEVVRSVGGYRRAYAHCEDYDLWLRLSERTRIRSLPERLMLYRHSDSQVSSRHIVAQHVGAAVSWLAYCERAAGRPDPTEGLDRLPPVGQLDALFGRPGIDRAVRARVAPGLVYSEVALRSEGFDMLLEHVAEGGAREGLWRTAARLLTYAEPKRALRLAGALALG